MKIHFAKQSVVCETFIFKRDSLREGLPAPHVGKDGSTQIVTKEFQRQAATETSSKVTYFSGLRPLKYVTGAGGNLL